MNLVLLTSPKFLLLLLVYFCISSQENVVLNVIISMGLIQFKQILLSYLEMLLAFFGNVCFL